MSFGVNNKLVQRTTQYLACTAFSLNNHSQVTRPFFQLSSTGVWNFNNQNVVLIKMFKNYVMCVLLNNNVSISVAYSSKYIISLRCRSTASSLILIRLSQDCLDVKASLGFRAPPSIFFWNIGWNGYYEMAF